MSLHCIKNTAGKVDHIKNTAGKVESGAPFSFLLQLLFVQFAGRV
jgi:hypothetical protein